ncbi:DNA-directed RNA polymerase subunit beta [Hordeum vulgare]|nr:DNA-directed RNA polymerase subunit beta [Hordeum vulgare]
MMRRSARAVRDGEEIAGVQDEEERVRSMAKRSAGARMVIGLGLEMIDSLIELEEVLPNVLGIDLVLVGELCDHHVVGIESAFHHPLALEDLLLHCFEPRLYASSPLGPLNITDVHHPSCISID